MNCKYCNTPLSEDALVCNACGKAVEKDSAPAETLPNTFDSLLDEAYTAATEQSAFESNTPLTEVYQGEPDMLIPGQTFAIEKPKSGKKILLTTLICVLVLALTLTALSYFKVVHIPFLSDLFETEQPINEAPDASAEPVHVPPTFSDFSASCTDILVGEATEVLFTLRVENPSEDNLSCLAVFNGEMQLCLLTDDGKNGDKTANDGIYSGKVSLKSGIPQDVSLCAKLDLLQSNTVTLHFYLDLSAEELAKSSALLQTINNFTDYNQAKAFISSSKEMKAFTAMDNDQIIYYETIYGVSHVWPSAETSLVADYPSL